MWEDHYNFAQLVEDLGVGLYGTRETAPYWTVDGLVAPIKQMLSGDAKSEMVKAKARQIGELAREEPGRYVSAKVIAEKAIF